MLDVHTGAFPFTALWTLDVMENSAWLDMNDYVWCFQPFDFNRMCSYDFLTWYRYHRLRHTPIFDIVLISQTGAYHHFPTWYWHPSLGHTPFFHLDLRAWFLAYSNYLLAFPKRYIGAYPTISLGCLIPFLFGGPPASRPDPLSFSTAL